MRSKNYNFMLLLGIVAALLIAGGVFVLTRTSDEAPKTEAIVPEAPLTPEQKAEAVGAPEIAEIQEADFTKTYVNKKYRFSFNYPDDYTVTSIPDEATGGDTILLQKKGGKSGVQIAVSPFDEPNAVITPNRVEQEAGISIESPQDVLIGESGKGLAFIGKGTDFGTSREVWFVFGTTLYQMSTYIELDELLKNVLSTWQFN